MTKQEVYLANANGSPLSGFEAYPFIKSELKNKWEGKPEKVIRNILIQLMLDSKDDPYYTYLNAIEDLLATISRDKVTDYRMAKGIQLFTNWYLKNYKKA